MGYTTEFQGEFSVSPPLKTAHREFLAALADTRRMARRVNSLKDTPDPLRVAAGLPLGEEGEFYVGDSGQPDVWPLMRDSSIIDYNVPPSTQPGLWLQWVPSALGDQIMWDGGEKFYNYVEWLEYLIKRLLIPWGYALKGSVTWEGEDPNDKGTIVVDKDAGVLVEHYKDDA